MADLGRFYDTFKWQNESWIENRAKGNRFFLQFAFVLK